MLLIGLSAVGLVPCCLFYFGGFEMQLLEERILKDGKVFPGNVLKVDSFLNHQVDVELKMRFERLTESIWKLTKAILLQLSVIPVRENQRL